MIARSGPLPRWRRAAGLRVWRYWDILDSEISGMVTEETSDRYSARARDFHGWKPLTDSPTLEEAQYKVEYSRSRRATTVQGRKGGAINEARILRRYLEETGGNVGKAAKALVWRYPTRRTLDRAITRLGLRAWLTATYPRSARQPAKSTPTV